MSSNEEALHSSIICALWSPG